MSRREAELESKQKIRLEKNLQKELIKIFDEIAQKFIASQLVIGNFDEAIEQALSEQYVLVGDAFNHKMGDELPEDVEPDDSEIAKIIAALALYYLVRAPKQRRHIQKTTRKNVEEATEFGNEYARQQAVDGNVVTNQEQRIVAGNKLGQHLRNRAGTIAAHETQTIAETAKAAEVTILAGGVPDFQISNRNPLNIKKKWFTAGDERVRRYGRDEFDHVTADLQEVDTNEPFSVSGESMMYPADESLGASMGNRMGCRCGVKYDKPDMIKLRKQV